MLCAYRLVRAAILGGFCLLLVLPIGSTSHTLPPARLASFLDESQTTASLEAHVTEAPAQELVAKNLEKRALNICTQWSVIGASQVGCLGTQTCLFTAFAGYNWEYCGDINSAAAFATRCYDYPTSWFGISPLDIAYCPKTAPYCGEFRFVIPGKTFFNLGCSTVAYDLTVITTPGATFPSGPGTTTSPPPPPPSTTSVAPTPTTHPIIESSVPTTVVTPTVVVSSTLIALTSTSPSPSTATTASNNSPTPATDKPSSATTASKSALSSSSPSPSPLPCSDSQWEPSLQNWLNADVDHQVALWWANTTAQRGSYGFVEWLARSFGDLSHSQQCGLGQLCTAPDCPSFQTSGAPSWVYFVHISLMQINSLLNSMKVGMSDAETDLSLIISDMAANFFPWKDPSANLNHALPWILAVVSSFLSFIPFIGSFAPKVDSGILSAVTGSTQALTAAGFAQLSTGGADPVTHQLGTIQELGVLIENTTKTMRDELGTWSNTLFSGAPDRTGKTIQDYIRGGRFTLAYNIDQSFMDNFFLKVWVSRLVNEQWQDKVNAPSKTFVMCTNATASCNNPSKYTEGSRTCCLYSIDGNANYVPPPAIQILGNSTYNITPSDIVASSLHSYLAQGLTYDDSNLTSTIEQSISLTSNATFLAQGIQFQGVWTLQVCDVGQYGDWVAETSAGLMPCCCGPNCSETIQFWNNTGVLKLQGLHDKCKTQCSTCPTSAADSRLAIMGMSVVGSAYVLGIAYVLAMAWIFM